MIAENERRFCRVTLDGDKTTGKTLILLTVVGPNPVLMTGDGRFAKMYDVKEDKEHYFLVDKIVHIQLEEERKQQ